MKIVYGHTDSIFVKTETIENANSILLTLNTHIKKTFPNIMKLDTYPVVLEFEKFYSVLGVGSRKNRNVGLISWKDGKYLDEQEFTMTGFTAKRISETKLAKEIQITVLKMWVGKKSEKEIVDYLHEKYNQVSAGNIPISQIIKRTRFKEERFKIKCVNCKKNGWTHQFNLNDLTSPNRIPCCNNPNFQTIKGKRPTIKEGIEGVLFYNSHNTTPIKDSYVFLRIRNCSDVYYHPLTGRMTTPNYISGLNEKDCSKYEPDWWHYAQSVVKKAEPIFDAMGWDTQQITKDRNQRELEEWF